VDDPEDYVEDSDEIEDVSATVLQRLIEDTDSLAVLFCIERDTTSATMYISLTLCCPQMTTRMRTVWRCSQSWVCGDEVSSSLAVVNVPTPEGKHRRRV